jgi:hypothetical protein
MTPFQLEASANAPWTSTTVGLCSCEEVVFAALAGPTDVANRAAATVAVAMRVRGMRIRR